MKHPVHTIKHIALLALLGAVSLGTLSGCPADEGEEQEMSIEHYLAPCWGFGPLLCMQVRYDGTDGPLENFYDSIDGLTFEWGHRYEVRVLVTDIENPPPDGATQRFELLELISDTPVTDNFNLTLTAEFVDGDPATNAFSLLGYRDVTCADAAVCEDIAVWLDAESAVAIEVAHSDDPSGPLIVQSAVETAP